MIKIEYLEEEIPVYDITVEDNHNFYANGVLVHNCQEIMLPTRAAKNFTQRIVTEFGSDTHLTKTKKETGEIALCNLSSINLEKWSELDEKAKTRLVDNLLRASDNMIENSFYPVPDGELSNKLRRPIGIGIANYANYLALNGCGYSDKKAAKLTHEIMEDVTFYVLQGSMHLAKEKGPYHYFKDSNWAKGQVPMDLYKMKDVEGYNFPLKHDWDTLRKDIKEYGVRFSYNFAIAPTATSGMIINATEGVEPVKNLFQMKEGTYTLPQIVPNMKKNRKYYDNAFEIPNTDINTLASIRQKFLDMGQSTSHYYENTDSAFDVISDIMDAEEKGMKSIYYLTPMKSISDFEGCESCSS